MHGYALKILFSLHNCFILGFYGIIILEYYYFKEGVNT